MLKNSSELKETISLFQRLMDIAPSTDLSESYDFAIKNPKQSPPPKAAVSEPVLLKKAEAKPESTFNVTLDDDAYRDDKLEVILKNMSLRGGFSSALILDNEGFVLSHTGEQYDHELLAALSSVLGTAMERIAKLMESHDASSISIDLNILDKAVLSRFSLGETSFFVLVVCLQDRDVREELEVTINEI